MHAKSDSEVTSLAPSSPRSPRSRPVYFVQSPSRDSHDGDSKLSFQSTPILSPTGSPLHPAFSSRSRDDSQLLSSSRTKSASSRKLLPQLSHHRHQGSRSFKGSKRWAARNVIEEEPEFADASKIPQIYTILFVFLSCVVFLIIFIFLFWLICRPSHPQLFLKNVIFHNFYMGEGSDASGVPTQMVSLNCTVQINYKNPSQYFGAHINPVNVVLQYSELDIAVGQILTYFQAKGTRKVISVVVQAAKVPLYGAVTGGSSTSNSKQGIPVSMIATLHSQFYVVGKMIKSKFQNEVSCNLVVDANTMALISPLRSSCNYSPPQ